MDRAIHHPNGDLITDSKWVAIKMSACRIANELLAIPDHASAKQRMKIYYRTHHAKEWMSTIIRLEAEQPLLKLCASNWKADHIFGNSVLAITLRDSDATLKHKHSKKKQEKGKGKGKGKGEQ